MKYFFIVNPNAGKKNSMHNFVPKVIDFFSSLTLPYQVFETKYPKHAISIVESIIKNNDDDIRIIAVGGDGTLNEVIQCCVNKKNVEVGLIPTGSGNDFLKTFGNEDDFLNLDTLTNSKSFKLDVIKANDDYSINICSVGLDAKVGLNIAKYKKMPLISGSMIYNLSVLEELTKKLGDDLELIIDDTLQINGNYLFAAICNGQYYGGGFNPSPNAIVNDGYLDLILIKVPKYRTLIPLVNLYKKGEYLDSPLAKDIVFYYKCKSLIIKPIKPAIVNIDGEIKNINKIEFKVLPQAINFIIPNTSSFKALISNQ